MPKIANLPLVVNSNRLVQQSMFLTKPAAPLLLEDEGCTGRLDGLLAVYEKCLTCWVMSEWRPAGGLF
jgi:hypothetical protein